MKNQLSFGLVLAYSYYMAANALQLQLNLYSNALNLQPLMEFDLSAALCPGPSGPTPVRDLETGATAKTY
ncbi:hypothetical protein EDD86DRAFT_248835 [Gorgonomyces haynaldii]|nr:hypothetical protein EDD86DRAFT_248835 [Gorgonomyces haynaldii]